jgi:hypothetical protein
MTDIKPRFRNMGSSFEEDGKHKLSTRYNVDEMRFLNAEAKRLETSLSEVVRTSVRRHMAELVKA